MVTLKQKTQRGNRARIRVLEYDSLRPGWARSHVTAVMSAESPQLLFSEVLAGRVGFTVTR